MIDEAIITRMEEIQKKVKASKLVTPESTAGELAAYVQNFIMYEHLEEFKDISETLIELANK